MWDDDFDDKHSFDGEAFSNTIVWAGEKLIRELLDRRAKYWPGMAEKDFVLLFDMVREVFVEWLGPEAMCELWESACYSYWEDRKEKEPKVKLKACERLMQESLPEWHKIVCEEKERKRKEKKRKNC